MNGQHRLSRRALLGGAVVAAAAFVPWGATRFGAFGSPSMPVDALAVRLRALLDDPAAAARLGRAYLDGLSRWPSLQELVVELLPPGATVESLQTSDTAGLHHGLSEQRSEDYRHGWLVPCDGWLVSVTEGRLAALHVIS